MHPALRQYVGRPPRFARYVAVGAFTGFAGVFLAFAIVHVIDARRANDRQAQIERRHSAHAENARDLVLARTLLRDYAIHAWPSWVAAHPERACPASIGELAPYVGDGAEVDPWGHAFHFTCRGSRFTARSDGPDGIRQTRDDLWSRP